MNLSKLEVGMRIKNYKELCKLIGEPIKSGKSRQIQLEKFGKKVEYHKEGNSFIIDDIKKSSPKTLESDNFSDSEGSRKQVIPMDRQDLSDYPIIYGFNNTADLDKFLNENIILEAEDEPMTKAERKLFDTIGENRYNLKVGHTYTYKQMTEKLKIEAHGGNQKISDMKTIEQWILLDKLPKGRYRVAEINKIPMPKALLNVDAIGQKQCGEMLMLAMMQDLVENNRISELESEGCLFYGRKSLCQKMCLINKNYRLYAYNHKQLAEDTNINIQLIHQFYKYFDRKLNEYLAKASAYLKSRCLATISNNNMALVFSGESRLATNKEHALVQAIERMVLEEFKLTAKWQVHSFHLEKDFYNRVNEYIVHFSKEDERFKSFKGCNGYYSCIKVITDPNAFSIAYHELKSEIVKSMGTINDMVLTDSEVYFNEERTNKVINLVNNEVPKGFGKYTIQSFYEDMSELKALLIKNDKYRYIPKYLEVDKYDRIEDGIEDENGKMKNKTYNFYRLTTYEEYKEKGKKKKRRKKL